jgi:gp16 family phage-associated protein
MDKRRQIGDSAKQRIRAQGYPSMAAWAKAHGYKYRDMSDVVRGIRFGLYGTGREIAKKLSIPVQD